MRFFFIMLTLSGILGLMGCTFTSRPAASTISEAEAMLVLEQAVTSAQSGDAQALCGLGGTVSICEKFLQEVGGIETAPLQTPTVTSSYLIPDQPNIRGGRVLVVQGEDRKGISYRTEFLVFYNEKGQLIPYLPVYWSGVSMHPSM